MKAIHSRELGLAIASALGLETDGIHCLTLTLKAGKAAMVTVDRYITTDEANEIRELITSCHFVLGDDAAL